MNNDQRTSLDQHLARIGRGGAFFRTLYSISQLAVLFVLLGIFAEVWREARTSGADHDVWVWVTLGFVSCLKVFPFVLLMLGFRHLDNLFKAVHGAIDDLRTTV